MELTRGNIDKNNIATSVHLQAPLHLECPKTCYMEVLQEMPVTLASEQKAILEAGVLDRAGKGANSL